MRKEKKYDNIKKNCSSSFWSRDDKYNDSHGCNGGVRFVDDKGNVSFICDISMAGMGTYSSAAELELAYTNAKKPWVNVFFNKKQEVSRK